MTTTKTDGGVENRRAERGWLAQLVSRRATGGPSLDGPNELFMRYAQNPIWNFLCDHYFRPQGICASGHSLRSPDRPGGDGGRPRHRLRAFPKAGSSPAGPVWASGCAARRRRSSRASRSRSPSKSCQHTYRCRPRSAPSSWTRSGSTPTRRAPTIPTMSTRCTRRSRARSRKAWIAWPSAVASRCWGKQGSTTSRILNHLFTVVSTISTRYT